MALSYAPDPDLFIRTGGEVRISNFLLWQVAYSELVFTDCLWPDFGEAELDAALDRVRPPRAPLRRRADARRATRSSAQRCSMLKQRVITALVLLAVLLPALFAHAGLAVRAAHVARIRRGRLGMGAPERRPRARRSPSGSRWLPRAPPRSGPAGARTRRRSAWWVATLVWVLGGVWAAARRHLSHGRSCRRACAAPSGWRCCGPPGSRSSTPRRSASTSSSRCSAWSGPPTSRPTSAAGRSGAASSRPSISPGKSWEGVWSGMVGVLLLAAVWLLLERSLAVDSTSLYDVLWNASACSVSRSASCSWPR